MEQVHRAASALSVHVEHETVRPAVQTPGTETRGDHRQDEQRPARGKAEPRDADTVQDRRTDEDRPPTDPLHEPAAEHGTGRVGDGIREIDDTDTGVGLVERPLDRPDQRGNEQPRPADHQQRQAADDAGRESAVGGRQRHPRMLSARTTRWSGVPRAAPGQEASGILPST